MCELQVLPHGGPRVPLEIVDQVLKKLDPVADEHILCICALVSHIWLALSRAILFSSIIITLFRITANTGALKVVNGATILPYVRDICLSVPPTSEWTETHVPHLLAKFPECTTLRIPARWDHIRQWEIFNELLCESAPRSTVVARLWRLFSSSILKRRQHNVQQVRLISNDRDARHVYFRAPPPPPLVRLHTLHLDYPQHHLPVLVLLAPPSLHTLHLTLHESDPTAETLHASLVAAGAGVSLHTLILYFPHELRIGRPRAPLLTCLRVLRIHGKFRPSPPPVGAPDPIPTPTLISMAAHLLGCVLGVPKLEEVVVETEVSDAGDGSETAVEREHSLAELDRVVKTLPFLRTVRT
ncbi:hypothetical protein B0H12DRAFT_1240835 [Mycena haematopus]|nr:hypothetical protein B0H12DRAFT_1240835 [Mycena haematopus]